MLDVFVSADVEFFLYYASCHFEAIEAMRKRNGHAQIACLRTASGGRDQLGCNFMTSLSMWLRIRKLGVCGPALDQLIVVASCG